MTPENIRSVQLADDGRFPNHPRWPLLIYPAAVRLDRADPAGSIERLFHRNGWRGSWRNGIYPFQHYHSNAHEVLGVFRGNARVQFGGPNGLEIELNPGDVAILPAGTAHCNLGGGDDLGVVGAYPAGSDWDLCRGQDGEKSAIARTILSVPKPDSDPVFGRQGGLVLLWAGRQ